MDFKTNIEYPKDVKQKKIHKILIANRGEIAVRIMKTCKKLNIKTVAIYSDVDENELFVKMADEKILIGTALPRDSYANAEKVLKAAKESNADAIHPGYGFLSENYNFVKEVEKMGITFIGPSADSIQAMGDKIASKAIAQIAGVPVITGFAGDIKDEAHKKEIMEQIGFPLIIKASAGGGGKGMRIVYQADEFDEMFSTCVEEAKKNFNDGRVFIEKFIENPRHIEIQILADKYGKCVALGERECSIQRFNQKIIEESPSSFIDPDTRKKMYDVSKSLAKQCGYYSAGTVEYIVDSNKNFYFLEVNTRLQVEHPVTEYVTDKDLVEQMISVAEGNKLSFSQDDIKLQGHAIECRICAENTEKNFSPSSGRLLQYKEPEQSANVRVDSGCVKGSSIGAFYDAMIAKLICYGDNRTEAIEKSKQALNMYEVDGISTNIKLLEAILRTEDFKLGDISTGFIKKHYPNGFKGLNIDDKTLQAVIGTAISLHLKNLLLLEQDSYYKKTSLVINRLNLESKKELLVVVDNNKYLIPYEIINLKDIDEMSSNQFPRVKIETNESILDIEVHRSSESSNMYIVKNHNTDEVCNIHAKKNMSNFCFEISAKGATKTVKVYPAQTESYAHHMIDKRPIKRRLSKIISPISGLITSINVSQGQEVKKGETLFCIEAMKMENIITAEEDMVIDQIIKKEGDAVMLNNTIITLKKKN